MTIEAAFRNFLTGVTAITALTTTRIYQVKLPQSSVYPAVRVVLLLEPVVYALDGPMGLRKAILQVDAFADATVGADPYVAVTGLATAIDEAVSGYTGPMPDESPSLDVRGVFRTDRKATYDPDELRVLRIIQLYDVWYRA